MTLLERHAATVTRTAYLLGWTALLAVSHARALAQAPPPIVTLQDIGIQASFGLLERNTQPGVALGGPLDAAFSGDRVAVLDNMPPWVRIFDSEGRLLHTAVGRGESPGATRRPYSISATAAGGFLLTHERGLEWLDADGVLIRSLPVLDPALRPYQQPFRIIGAVEACGGDLVLQLESQPAPVPGAPLASSQVALVRASRDGELGDTLVAFAATRRDSRTYHPWLVDARPDRLLAYTEEIGTHRLLEMTCDGTETGEVPVDSLGQAVQVSEPNADGRLVFSSARSPHPAGLLRLEDRVLWATRVMQPREDGGQDSVTVVTSIRGDAPARQIAIRGWFQLLDAAPDGSLLFGNSWTLALNWEWGVAWDVVPAVFRIDGNNLRAIIDRIGALRLNL